MLFKLFGIVVTIIIGAILGLKLSKDIHDSVLYSLFWVLYVITYLTFSNVIAVSLFYSALRTKTGPPGPRGPNGVAGDIGEMGVCKDGCEQMECIDEVRNAFINKINELSGRQSEPVKFNNLFLRHQMKNICTSKQFKKIAEIKGADSVMAYIKQIVEEWAKLIYEASGTEFVESPGSREDFPWKNNKDPFKEIEMYDIYYWKRNKLFKPIGLDVCDDPKINKNLPQHDLPRLYLVKTNLYDKQKDIFKRDHYSFKPRTIRNTKINKQMFPMGDVIANNSNRNYRAPRYVDGISLAIKGKYKETGPEKMSALIAGEVRPPRGFHQISETLYRPIPEPNYKCLGDVSRGSNTQDYRCVPEECVEQVDSTVVNGQLLYNNGRHGSAWGIPGSSPDMRGNAKGEENYNLFRSTSGNSGGHEGFYKIRDICLNSGIPPLNSKKENSWKANTWYGYPEKDPNGPQNTRYSIFDFLGLVPEGILKNENTKHKVHFVSTNKDPNEYVIKYYLHARGRFANWETSGNHNVKAHLVGNPDKKEQQWYLEYDDPEHVYVRSKKTGKYLGLHVSISELKDKFGDHGPKLIVKQYNSKHDHAERTVWKIMSTTTGQRNIKQKK